MSLRQELIEQIADHFNVNDGMVKSKRRMSAPLTHLVYEEVTGKQSKPENGAVWHLNKINEELGIELNRTLYSGNQALPTSALKQVLTFLQHQQ